MTVRRAWIPAAGVLAVVYLATLAPGVTFWDAGEFIAAAHSLGIPHPPGTPLFILLLHSWAAPWPDHLYAVATNAFSALCTVVAAAVTASLVARWIDVEIDRDLAIAAGIAAALCAGAMSTVWSNATETEVYAASLALAVITIFAADRAGRDGGLKSSALVAYLFGLAAPLHVSALVAAPAAILLASTQWNARVDWRRASTLFTAALIAMAIGTWSPIFATFAGLALIATLASVVLGRAPKPAAGRIATELAAIAFAAVLGATPLIFMLIRARFDPAINQGNPSTLHALVEVIARRQYDLAPIWPRRAPLWIQLGNWFEYADWQTALSLGPTVIPTVPRVLISLAFAVLVVYGAVTHRRADRRSWIAMLALFVCGSLGVTLYLNLRASPSFGWGILPAGAMREARERDYFFVLGFWVAGIWAGIGATALARRFKLSPMVGVAAGLLAIALNWAAVSRRGEPDASLPREVGRALLAPLPPRAVLFVAGDNDTYPLWYSQTVLGLRRDVTIVTFPLLGAAWYDAEIRRRNPTLRLADAVGDPARVIADAARANGRPVLASLGVEPSDRIRLNGCWIVIGFFLLDNNPVGGCQKSLLQVSDGRFDVDEARTGEWVRRFGRAGVGQVRPSIDPVGEYFAKLLDCPSLLLDSARKSGRGVSLDSTCNP